MFDIYYINIFFLQILYIQKDMSEISNLPFPVVKVQEPRIDVQPRVYYANMGGSNITQQVIKSTTCTPNQIVFSTTTPSPNVFLSRRMYIKYKLHFTIGGPGRVIDTLTCGLRAFPLTASTETLTFKINNATVTTNLRDTIHALMHFGSSPEERNRWMSGIPSLQDQFQVYSDGADPEQAGMRNPFAWWATNGLEQTRQIGNWGTLVDPNNFVTIDLVEPVFISPLNWSEAEVPGFLGVTSFQVIYTLGNLARAWSDAVDGAAATRITDVQFEGNTAELHLEYITPQITYQIPTKTFYPYYELGRYVKSTGVDVVGNANPYAVAEAGPFYTDTLSFSSIPKRIYIYARKPEDSRNMGWIANQTDSFAQITGINITWNNQAGVLSSASEKDLHDISVRAGCDMSWIQWRKYLGSVLCIRPGIDIPLGALEANGTGPGPYQFQATLKLKNLSAANGPFDITVVAVLEGFLEIDNRVVKQHTGELTQQIIADASFAPPGTLATIKNMYGGAWYDDIWNFVKKPLNVVSKVGQAIAPALNAIPGYGAMVSPIVSGVSGAVSNLTGGRRRKGSRARSRSRSRSKGRRGGKKMSRSALRVRIA
jgi:hypothetical protein